VVVLRAQGPVFSAGHNVKEMRGSERDPAYFARCFALCSEVMQAVRGLRVPVIAQVDGLATAAGAQLVASCDLVVASEDSHFATPGTHARACAVGECVR
jgi:enoyl-CoA hydratase/carnithine racemase